ncbi:tandem-95 repeat protein, partial [Candidatus Poribacteria bacterium]|nr:tandem-95 repeat protein [Candidatus Poribacteria bacterium]
PFVVAPGEPLVIPLGVIDPDPTSAVVAVTVSSAPSSGNVSTAVDPPSVTYSSNAAFIGTDTFSVTVTDDLGGVSNPLLVSVTVTDGNLPPIAGPVAPVTIARGDSAEIVLTGTDADVGDTLTFAVDTPPEHGTVSVASSTATYTPEAGYVGADLFTFTASDGKATSLPSPVRITVGNASPVVKGGTVATNEDTEVAFTIDATDPDGDDITLALTGAPEHGSLRVTGLAVRYKPDGDYSGSDSFAVTASDGETTSAPATFTITVVEVDDPATLNPSRSLSNLRVAEGDDPRTVAVDTPTPLFLDPDSDVALGATSSDSDVVTVAVTGSQLTLEFGAAGIAIVSVTAAGSDEAATMLVEVQAGAIVNEPPVVTLSRSLTAQEGEEASFTPSVTDPDGDVLTFELVGVEAASGEGSEPTVTVDSETGETTVLVDDIEGARAQFRVEIQVTDGVNDPVEIATVVSVTPSNSAPTIDAPGAVEVAVGESVRIPVEVTDADTDDEITITAVLRTRSDADVVDAMASVIRSFNAADATVSGDERSKTLTLGPGGRLDGKLIGIQWFGDDGTTSVSATTEISVGADVNRPPVIAPIDDVVAAEGESIRIPVAVSDPEEGDVALSVSGLAEGATFEELASSIVWVDIGYDRAGAYTFSVRAVDDGGLTATESVRVDVLDVNRPPVLEFTPLATGTATLRLQQGGTIPDTVTLTRGERSAFRVGVTDADGDTLRLEARGLPAWVRVTRDDDPDAPRVTLVFEPPRDAEGFSLVLIATDGGGQRASASIEVGLEGVANVAPVIDALQPVTVVEGEVVAFTVSASDADGDALTVVGAPLPARATFEAGTFEWTTAQGDARDDDYAITVTVDDDNGGVSETLVFVTVLDAPNRVPTLTDLSDIVLTVGEETTANLLAAAADEDGDPLTVELNTSFPPTQMSFDDATGELTLSPEPESDGAYRAAVTAVDGRGGQATRSFLITVLPDELIADGDPEILEAFVSPSIGTAADTYEFVTVFRNPAGDVPAVANLFVTDADGFEREAALTPDADADLGQGASFGATLTLPAGVYAFRVVASFGLTLLERDGDGPTVTDAPIAISALTPTGATDDIAVGFEIDNPTPGETVSLTVEYRREGDDAWSPASVSGDVHGLASGTHELTWMSHVDAPDETGALYQLRASVVDRGERVSSGFPVINAPPPAPTLDPLAPSAALSLVVTGAGQTPGGLVTLYIDGRTEAQAKADADGAFRFVTADLTEGAHDLWATVELLGLTSAPSGVVVAAVDTAMPSVEILAPARGSIINTLDALISFKVDYGLSGGEPDEVTVNLNGRAVGVTFDAVAGIFSARKRVFDERAYLITVRALKRNGLAATEAWTFIASLAADDELPPDGTSFRPLGSIRETQPEIRLTVSDAAAGTDPDSIVVQLDGLEIATEYLPADDRSGAVVGQTPEALTDGEHTITATFADLAGNEGSAEWSFVVTTVAPDAPTIETPDVVTAQQPVTVSGSALPLVDVVVTDGQSVLSTTNADADGAWTAEVSFDADGSHDVVAQARDALGSLSDPSNAMAILLDREPPGLRVVTPTPGSATGSLTPTISGVIADGVSGVESASVTLTVNGETVPAGYEAAQGAFSYTPDPELQDGEEVLLTLSAEDIAGNVALLAGAFTTDTRLADVTPPVILSPRVNGVDMTPGAETQVAVTDLDIEFRATDDLSGVARIYVSYDGESIDPAIEGDVASFSVQDAEEGSHAVVLGVEDVAGNQGDPVVLGILVRTQLTPPTLELPTATNIPDLLVTGAGVPEGVTTTVFVNGLPVATSVQGDRLTGGPARLAEGANVVSVTITDEADNVATSEPRTVVLDVTAPLVGFVSPTPDAAIDAGADTLRAQVSDAIGIDAASAVLTLDDAVVQGEFLDDATIEYVADDAFGVGRHFASIVVRDLAGNEARRGLAFVVDGSAPEVAGIVPADGEIVPSLTPLVAATIVDDDVDLSTLDVLFGPEDGALQSVLSDPSFVLDLNLGQFGFAPSLEDRASYQVLVRVSDGVGNPAELSWTFHVDTDAEDVGEPAITILFPAPGQTIGDTGLDTLAFSVGAAGGIDSVAIFVNDPRGDTPLSLGRLVDEGIAEFNRLTGVVIIHGRRLFAPYQAGRSPTFSLDPLELNALERSLTGGSGASFDPLELNALERSLGSDTGGGANVAALERSLTTSPGLLGVGENTMGVQALDLAGNVSFASWSFSVSLDPPAAPTFDALPELTNQQSSVVTGHIPGLAGSGALPITLSLRVNGVTSGRLDVETEDGEFAFASVPLNVGENTITATAQDVAGNLSDRSGPLTLVVDSQPPTVSLNPIASTTALLELTVTGSVRDDRAGDLSQLSLVLNGDETQIDVVQGAFSG